MSSVYSSAVVWSLISSSPLLSKTDLDNLKTKMRSTVSVREGQGVVLLCGTPPHSGGKKRFGFSRLLCGCYRERMPGCSSYTEASSMVGSPDTPALPEERPTCNPLRMLCPSKEVQRICLWVALGMRPLMLLSQENFLVCIPCHNKTTNLYPFQ